MEYHQNLGNVDIIITSGDPDTTTVYQPNLGYDPHYIVLWKLYSSPQFTPGNQCSVCII